MSNWSDARFGCRMRQGDCLRTVCASCTFPIRISAAVTGANGRRSSCVRELVQGLEIDLLVHTGDFLHYDSGVDNVCALLEVLPQPRLGSYGVLGNHDYTHYNMVAALPRMWRTFRRYDAMREAAADSDGAYLLAQHTLVTLCQICATTSRLMGGRLVRMIRCACRTYWLAKVCSYSITDPSMLIVRRNTWISTWPVSTISARVSRTW